MLKEIIAALGEMGPMEISEAGVKSLVNRFRSPVDMGRLRESITPEQSLGQFLASRDRVPVMLHGRDAVITVAGPLEYRMSWMGYFYGFASYHSIRNAIRTAANDSRVDRIILDFDSPGGSVVGCVELAEEIYSMRGEKAMIAVANPGAASAALKLAVACDRFVVLGSGYVGSIGTMVHAYSIAEMLKNEGVDYRILSNPDAKGEDWPEREISDERITHWTGVIDELSDAFRESVAKYRGVTVEVVASEFGGGRVMNGVQAVDSGLADEVGTLESVLLETATGSSGESEGIDDSSQQRWS